MSRFPKISSFNALSKVLNVDPAIIETCNGLFNFKSSLSKRPTCLVASENNCGFVAQMTVCEDSTTSPAAAEKIAFDYGLTGVVIIQA